MIALALYMQSSYREVLRCLLEGVQWLLDPSAAVKVAGKSGISQARTRLGSEPLRQLHDAVVRPIAVGRPEGRGIGNGGLVSLDGSTLEVADDPANEAGLWSAWCQPREQRLSASPVCVVGRERDPCVVRQPDGGLWNG